jgi:hypothetical protein
MTDRLIQTHTHTQTLQRGREEQAFVLVVEAAGLVGVLAGEDGEGAVPVLALFGCVYVCVCGCVFGSEKLDSWSD